MLLAWCVLMLCQSAAAKEFTYQEVKGDLLKTRIYELDNGLKIYLSVNKEKPRIQTYIAVRTGSRNDPAETTGLAHYLEHLMFKGTKRFGTSAAAKEAPYLADIEKRYERYRLLTDEQARRKAYHEIDSVSQLAAQYFIPNEYDKLMSAIGAEGTNAFTSNDVTCYVDDIPANEVDNWAKIQADRFQNMVIRGFHTELEAVYEEYNIGLASDGRKQFNALLNKLFPTHPYGTQTTIGTQEHLKNPSIVNIKNYFNRYYVPSNIAICMAGDFDPDAVMRILSKYFGAWKAGEPRQSVQAPTFAAQPLLTHAQDTTVVGLEAENILLGWRTPAASAFENDTLQVVSQLLSNSKAGLMDLNLDQKMKYLGGGAGVINLAEYGVFVLQGMPKENQSLDEVKALLLGEIANLKKGNFAATLLPSVINNMKLQFYESLDNNRDRTDLMMQAFINGQSWSDVVQRIQRISGITKAQIVAFANRFFKDNYVCVYKTQGTDSTLKKIDKPAITPIPLNREAQSAFLQEIAAAKVTPIAPKFVNFEQDIVKGKTHRGVPVLYVKNNDNGLFELTFHFPFGKDTNKQLEVAAEYVGYLGAGKMSASQIKQRFYELACDYSINVSDKETNITLSGLNENMPQALALLKTLLLNAKVDKAAYASYVDLLIKSRSDKKAEQQANFAAAVAYGKYGKYNPSRNILTNDELKRTNPQALVNLLKELTNYAHTLLYYGADDLKTLTATVDRVFNSTTLLPAPKGKDYLLQETTQNSILLAPYDAKNIYMVQFNNSNREWKPEHSPVIALFNEYFGGSMNSVVFQELRETRGLAYSAAASYIVPTRKAYPEHVQTYIITQNDKMMDCVKAFNQIIDTIPLSQVAFELAKQALTKRIATERTTKMNIIRKYLSAKRLGINYDINKHIYEALPAMTLQNIVDFEKQTMARKPFRYVILGDEKALDMNALQQIAPIQRVSTEEIFGY